MSTTPPILQSFIGVDTLDALAQRVIRKVNEPLGPAKLQVVYDDIADGLESIWMSALLATLSKFSRGPVTQIVLSPTTQLVSIPDPTSPPVLSSQTASFDLGLRQVYCSYCLVTDSGSTTNISPLAEITLIPGIFPIRPAPTAVMASPLNPSTQDIPRDVVGWYPYAGYNPDGSDQGLQSLSPLAFNQSWFEPPSGLTQAPNAPSPPPSNTTGDNIFAIDRIDVQNVDQTWTSWLQSSHNSSFFTEFQHKIATTTTWQPFVYDFIDSQQLEVRPAPTMAMSAVYFYVHKPRRPRFPQSRLPFTSFACQGFLFDWAMAQYLLGIYEMEASDRWMKRAEEERLRIILQISAGNWNQNATVRPFMR